MHSNASPIGLKSLILPIVRGGKRTKNHLIFGRKLVFGALYIILSFRQTQALAHIVRVNFFLESS